jgi:hypothetical protein
MKREEEAVAPLLGSEAPMTWPLPALLLLLVALCASLAVQARGSSSACRPHPPRRPGNR